MSEPLRIDVPAAVKAKLPGKYVPLFIIRWLERIVHVPEMNEFLKNHTDIYDFDFARTYLTEGLHCSYSISGKENIPRTDKPLLFVSNHPLGGLDGIVLALMLGEQRNYHLRLIVTDLLMYIKPLNGIFVPVNKVGKQSREYAANHQKLWESDMDILTFPAGACSRLQHLQGEGMVIRDLEWKKSFIRHAVQYHRDIVPIFFDGKNSNFFYRLAYWRKKLGIPVNIEMLYLADEMYKASGTHFNARIGQPIPYTTFDNSKTPVEWAQWVKQQVYDLQKEGTISRE